MTGVSLKPFTAPLWAGILVLSLLSVTVPSAFAQSASTYRVGERVEVLSAGKWYPAVIIEIGAGPTYGGLPKVHYDDYGEEFDEWVNLDRVRRAASTASSTSSESGSRPAASTEQGSADSGSPVGRYLCQAFEAGELHTQGEFVLNRDGSYREVIYEENGRWSYERSSRQVTFTGVLQNGARATYYPDLYKGRRRNGVIMFDWGNEVIRECYRSRER